MNKYTDVVTVGLVSLLAACAAGEKPAGFNADDASAPPGAPSSPSPDRGTVPGAPDDAGTFMGGDVGTPSGLDAVVYGQSPDALYRLDPLTKSVKRVGAFDGCSGVIDIALDSTSKMYGTTFSGLWSIDAATAKCTRIGGAGPVTSYPNSLSFVPQGTVDANSEALVGYEGGNYFRLDTATGAKTKIGELGGGLQSSGDIVSVKGGATYLTVTGTGCMSGDCLVEVNPATGALVKNWGNVHHTQVYGLAFWAGSVYGFDNGGELFEVTFKNGQLVVTDIVIPMEPAGLVFYGAGSTTSAPVTPATN